ncbi:MAG: hypothetical protein K2M19_08500 [Muribaculaceae bacterium]|nr:hypothetical protein [Muribaculaceae bacterium]
MEAVKIALGVIIVVFAIIKTVKDDMKKKSPQPPRPIPVIQDSEDEPQAVKASTSRPAPEAEGARAVLPDLAPEADAETGNVRPRRRSGLRSAFINSEIFNRKF